MDETGARTITQTVAGLYRALHDQIREHVRGMDPGTLNWRPLPKANSIAVLVVHMLGAEREVMRVLRLQAFERVREEEFKAETEATDLLALLDKADRDLEEFLGTATAADLTELRPRGDRPPKPGIEWLLSNYGHAREHMAHLELTKQLYDSRT
jgi:uncharacterized damage-inducible protein DinB